ncbi:hypothetical protein RIF23_10910 [Lipingzhangella sp. LS1_29]|uniref:Htaa domain-containing protein n=1 Tax=Lipingzhangella rawalii TaxID=2055835 RepID=A0ABU2H7I2_9ACTN|nr:hypothetical protein [Lipingzhangella rawalii]MDS1270810.1 hypothetical protein [Lipingzhangella rawalii]
MSVTRRCILAGSLVLPAAAAVGLTSTAARANTSRAQVEIGWNRKVLSEQTNCTLLNHDVELTAVEPAELTTDTPRPGVHYPVGEGDISLDLQSGSVTFEGGFRLQTSDTAIEVFDFTADLSSGTATAEIRTGSGSCERVEVFAFDITEAEVDLVPPEITVAELPLYARQPFVEAVNQTFGVALLAEDSVFAHDAAAASQLDLADGLL